MKFPDIGGGTQGQNLYIKMTNGARIQGVFRGEPKIFRQHWVEGRSQKCEGKKTCQYCVLGDKPKLRFKINFLTPEGGVWMAKIFEQGFRVYADLKGLHDNEYNLEETCVVITRKGEGTDTRYSVLPAKNNGGLTPKDFATLAKVPLNPLSDKLEAVENDFKIPEAV